MGTSQHRNLCMRSNKQEKHCNVSAYAWHIFLSESALLVDSGWLVRRTVASSATASSIATASATSATPSATAEVSMATINASLAKCFHIFPLFFVTPLTATWLQAIVLSTFF